jgi:pimeloyl-ACP methyl ester carboxylesterase
VFASTLRRVSAVSDSTAQDPDTHRVGHLVIMCGVFPGGPLAEAPPGWRRMLYSEPVMWLLSVLARPVMVRMAGVPEGFPRDADDAAIVDWAMLGMFPLRPRAAGLVFDSYSSNPEITGLPLEQVAVPTLVVHAVDDKLASYDAAAAAAARVPGARLVSLDSGGHLMLGQTERVGT